MALALSDDAAAKTNRDLADQLQLAALHTLDRRVLRAAAEYEWRAACIEAAFTLESEATRTARSNLVLTPQPVV